MIRRAENDLEVWKDQKRKAPFNDDVKLCELCKLIEKGCFDEEEGKIVWKHSYSIPHNKGLQQNNIKQKEYIQEIIKQIYSIPVERYLACEMKPSGDGKKDKTSWCREERQYALFLYNILLDKKNGRLAKRSKGNDRASIRGKIYDAFKQILGYRLDSSSLP